ncbi:MAG TPA: hypothetical protein DHV62_06245 [Elusimicrobia bacterium]|jgi:hypothetical protein|nr:hypothetical protein [Elusimicrobiota bacterium]
MLSINRKDGITAYNGYVKQNGRVDDKYLRKVENEKKTRIPLIPRYICETCREKFIFASSLTKNKEGKQVCGNCLRKEQSEEKNLTTCRKNLLILNQL